MKSCHGLEVARARALLILLSLLVTPAQAADLPGGPGGREVGAMDPSLFGTSPALQFSVDEGLIHNRFYRRGPVAAHMLVRSGSEPRVVVAFPAGTEGGGLWLESAEGGAVTLTVDGPLEGIWAEGEPWGVSGVVTADTDRLRIRQLALGSVRILRGLETSGTYPAFLGDRLTVQIDVRTRELVLRRTLLDGRTLQMRIEALGDARVEVDGDGDVHHSSGGAIEFAGSAPLRLKVTTLTEARPLLPIPAQDILQADAEVDDRDLQALAFLAYEEKLLAGSWRFLTYFGRDTLLSVAMLMPAVQPEVTEAGLRSVLVRLDPRGDVAHEEDIGDFAAWRRLAEGADPAVLTPEELASPIHDYKMVDDDFLLAPVAAAYLLDDPAGRERAPAFLGEDCGGRTCATALRRNLLRVLDLAEPFADEPRAGNLIALREGEPTGEWRDSTVGLGGGRIPYNVNGVLVPAALRAAARLLVDPRSWGDTANAARALELAEAWDGAADLFAVEVPERVSRRRIKSRCRAAGLEPGPALASLDGPVSFPALALDGKGRPLPVMHSDDGFDLLFGDPPEERLRGAAERITRPFPAGLRTDVGILVANASLAGDEELRALFTPDHYHGEVVWSWQQALLAAGLRRQLARDDLTADVRAELERAQVDLWEVIEATAEQRRAELWSWRVEEGRIVAVPFGQGGTHLSESNAVQLWSTVYIGVRPP